MIRPGSHIKVEPVLEQFIPFVGIAAGAERVIQLDRTVLVFLEKAGGHSTGWDSGAKFTATSIRSPPGPRQEWVRKESQDPFSYQAGWQVSHCHSPLFKMGYPQDSQQTLVEFL